MKLLGKRNRSCFNNKELPLCAWEGGWRGGGAFGITPSSDDLSMHWGWTLKRAGIMGSSGFVIC